MSERYPIPVRDIKNGARITGNILFSVYEGVRPTAELMAQKQAQRFLRTIFGKKRI